LSDANFLSGFPSVGCYKVTVTTDGDLLRSYAEAGSEEAFAELVRRHLNLVYSAALRQVNGNAPLAQDVAQAVFSDLARKAASLSSRPSLTGWLYTSARFAAAKTVRAEQRHRTREHEAASMRELLSDSGPELDWTQLAPTLDAVMHELKEADREAILLRFFENRQLTEIGKRFGLSEDAARKRVDRALEKLRERFTKRGITTTAAALSVAITAHAVQAAPTGLCAAISTAAALAGTALAPASIASTTKAIAMNTLRKTLITATFAVSIGTGIYEARQASLLRTQVQILHQQQAPLAEQIAQLQNDNAALSNQLAQANRSAPLSSERLRELLKLRGEVGMLRRQREVERIKAAAPSPPTAASASRTPTPFQVQLVLDQPGDDTEPKTNNVGGARGETLHVRKTPLLDYTAISSATVTMDATSGAPRIDIEFSELGKELFAAITRENLNHRLAIVMDGQLFSAPVIRSEISEGKAQLTGSYTEEEARTLAAKINDAIRDRP